MEGELLTVNPKPRNEFDRYAPAVCKGETVVGHMPRKISQICWYFEKEAELNLMQSYRPQKVQAWKGPQSSMCLRLRRQTSPS